MPSIASFKIAIQVTKNKFKNGLKHMSLKSAKQYKFYDLTETFCGFCRYQ